MYKYIPLIFLLTSCSDTLYSHQIEPAIEFCKEHKGVGKINYINYTGLSVICIDGTLNRDN